MDFDKLIDNFLKRDFKAKTIGRYYPSDVGGCLRKTWFTYKKPKELDSDIMKVFEAGNRMHDFVSDVLKSEKNKEVELLDREIPIKIEELDFTISGRIDNLVLVKINGKKVLIEVKSAKFLPKEPREQNSMQLQLYMHALNIHDGALLYIQKDNLKTRWFDIIYNEEILKKIIKRFEILHKHLISDIIPDPEAKKDKEKEWMCRGCNYIDECEVQ